MQIQGVGGVGQGSEDPLYTVPFKMLIVLPNTNDVDKPLDFSKNKIPQTNQTP